MLSVRRRDVRKGIELGFESGAEMEEPELEEGEACFYQEFDDDDNSNYDPNVDLDVALSYIDEKLQDVLGHFQKDFEASVTPQNLGAKFGEYGSFLPTYQRAPAWPHLRSPVKVDNHKLETPLSKSHTEGGVQLLSRHEEASYVSNVAKRTEAKLSGRSVDASSSKVKFEMGSDNLPTQKMAKFYNTLGCHLSPSSSLGDSPCNIEGDALKESPTRILQIMTSLPVDENLLLSPLTDYFINLTIQQKQLQRECKSTISQKLAKASPKALYSLKSEGHNIKEKKPKPSQKVISSLQLKNKKEINSDTLARENPDIASSKDNTNGGNIDMKVQLKENSKLEGVKGAFCSQMESNVLREIQAESAELIKANATCQEQKGGELQLPSSSGRKKKSKGTRVHDKRGTSVPKKEKENPKTNEDKAMAVNVYKDLFGEMELDEELDTEKNCSVDQGDDDMATDKKKITPNSAMEKEIDVKKTDRQSMLEINGTKETNVQISQIDKAQFVRSSKKKVQVTTNKPSLNGTSHSHSAKELESTLLREPNKDEKYVDNKIENERRFEQISCDGEHLSSENNRKRAHDQNGHRASKKIRTDHLPQINGSHQIKSVNKSLSRTKEENENCNSEINKCTSSEGAKESTKSDVTTKVRDNSGIPSNHDQKQNLRPNIDKKSIKNELDKTENGVNHLTMNTSEGDDAVEALKPKNNGIKWRQSTANGHKVGDKDIPISGHTILKEAKDLKHLADRLKSAGSAESTGLYFEASLKFLQSAFLLETSSGESAKASDLIQSMQIYSSTGQLCLFCATQYEKSMEMATAALAYKCMEVAYMRVIYSSRGRASRDCHELETASQISARGESPLSSASDVDNLNNLKADKAKSIVSPLQVAALGNHVISAGNRPTFVRLLSYAQDVNFAMEASRKCKFSFTAANQRMEVTENKEDGIASVKRAIDFNFQDVEGLLRLVRLAMEAISH